MRSSARLVESQPHLNPHRSTFKLLNITPHRQYTYHSRLSFMTVPLGRVLARGRVVYRAMTTPSTVLTHPASRGQSLIGFVANLVGYHPSYTDEDMLRLWLCQ